MAPLPPKFEINEAVIFGGPVRAVLPFRLGDTHPQAVLNTNPTMEEDRFIHLMALNEDCRAIVL
jgi:hypothetical protein